MTLGLRRSNPIGAEQVKGTGVAQTLFSCFRSEIALLKLYVTEDPQASRASRTKRESFPVMTAGTYRDELEARGEYVSEQVLVPRWKPERTRPKR